MAIQQTFDFLGPPREARRASEPVPAGSVPTGSAPLKSTPVKSAPLESAPSESVPVEPWLEGQPTGVTLDVLRERVGCISTVPRADGSPVLSTGSDGIDRLLPRRGLKVDGITEWIGASGVGATALSLICAATHLNSLQGHGALAVVSPPEQFYPPAAVSIGISPERVVWVRPTRHADMVWAIDQALRCDSVSVVWATIGERLDSRDARRFQLAAEIGCTAGLFVRPENVRGRPSFSDVRLHVDGVRDQGTSRVPRSIAHQRFLKVTLDRCRGGNAGASVTVRIDDRGEIQQVTRSQLGRTVHEQAAVIGLASELAHPTASKRKRERQRA